jgi:hypothetical protein
VYIISFLLWLTFILFFCSDYGNDDAIAYSIDLVRFFYSES